MRVFVPLIFAVALFILLGVVELLLLRFFNPPWWRIKLIRKLAVIIPLFGVVAVIFMGVGEYKTIDWLTTPMAVIMFVSFILLVSLMFSLPVSGLVHLFHWLTDRRTKYHLKRSQTPEPNRRLFLKATAAAVPVVALSAGVSGVTKAFTDPRVFIQPIPIKNLPSDLNGFRILHLSDLHLQHFVTLDDLENLLQRVESYKPDLIFVTGDIADDLKLLGDALVMIDSLNPPYGSYACLGNHEYFRGIAHVRRIHEKSPIPLLINDGLRLRVNDSSIFISGIDDPRILAISNHDFFKRAIDQVMKKSSSPDIYILMSHRPDAFDDAAINNIHLTLAGHTHGGQIGLGGRSLFEPIWREKYLWGYYRKENCHLYTSSGVGHWFPFRLGCPPEAPVIELQSV